MQSRRKLRSKIYNFSCFDCYIVVYALKDEREREIEIPNRKEVKRMKKLLVLFVAISFFACFSLVACGPSEQAPAPAKEEAKPAPAPAPATDTAAPAPASTGTAPAPAPSK